MKSKSQAFDFTVFQCFFDGEQGILYMYVGRYDDINKLKNLQQLFETQNSHLVHHQEMIKLKHEAGTCIFTYLHIYVPAYLRAIMIILVLAVLIGATVQPF